MFTLLGPNIFETTLGLIPASKSKVAAVWRKSWNRMRGTPAFWMSGLNNADLVSSVYGTTKLLGFEGACYLRLRQPAQAQSVLAASLKRSLHAHHQSLIHIDFARSFIQQGSPQEACAFAGQALEYVQQTGSNRAFRRILSLREDLHRWDRITEVKELDERITLAKKEQNNNG